MNLICNMCIEIVFLKLQPQLPGANELTFCDNYLSCNSFNIVA